MKKLTRLTLALFIVLVASGCVGNMEDLNRYISDVKQRPADPIDPIPPVSTYTPVEYVVAAERDPFVQVSASNSPGNQGGAGNGPAPDPNRVKEHLEKFSLDTLLMVGTFNQGQFDWALVKDPDNVIHRVAVGNYMGQNDGQVVAISPDAIDLSEFIPDGSGGWLVREVSMALEES